MPIASHLTKYYYQQRILALAWKMFENKNLSCKKGAVEKRRRSKKNNVTVIGRQSAKFITLLGRR